MGFGFLCEMDCEQRDCKIDTTNSKAYCNLILINFISICFCLIENIKSLTFTDSRV